MLNTEQQTKTHTLFLSGTSVSQCQGGTSDPASLTIRTAGTLKTANSIDEGTVEAQCFTINCTVRGEKYCLVTWKCKKKKLQLYGSTKAEIHILRVLTKKGLLEEISIKLRKKLPF